jgi:5-methylcytosine-specific restriction protein A
MPLRPCLDCGTLTSQGNRCPAHRRQLERSRPPRPTTLTRDRAEQERRAVTVAAWRAVHGDWCPGWGRPPHHATDLTADHIVAAKHGGTALGVLCRACNGAKQDR